MIAALLCSNVAAFVVPTASRSIVSGLGRDLLSAVAPTRAQGADSTAPTMRYVAMNTYVLSGEQEERVRSEMLQALSIYMRRAASTQAARHAPTCPKIALMMHMSERTFESDFSVHCVCRRRFTMRRHVAARTSGTSIGTVIS